MNPTLTATAALTLHVALLGHSAAAPAAPESVLDPLAQYVAADAPKSAPKREGAPPPKLLEFGARVGVSIPSGRLDRANEQSDLLGPSATLDLLLNLRLGSRFMVTPYVGASRGTASANLTRACEASSGTSSCEAYGFTVGLMARIVLTRNASAEVWGGYGFSHDFRTAGGRGIVADLEGNEHHLLTGVEWFIRGTSRMGLFVDVSLGVYDRANVQGSGGSWSASGPRTHQWTTFGAQVFY